MGTISRLRGKYFLLGKNFLVYVAQFHLQEQFPKLNRFITSRISKSMKSRGFTETFPSIYVPIVINRFSFGQ